MFTATIFIIAATIRVLAWKIADLANPPDKQAWFVALGENVFSYTDWPAAGFVDTEKRCFMKLEVGYGEARI